MTEDEHVGRRLLLALNRALGRPAEPSATAPTASNPAERAAEGEPDTDILDQIFGGPPERVPSLEERTLWVPSGSTTGNTRGWISEAADLLREDEMVAKRYDAAELRKELRWFAGVAGELPQVHLDAYAVEFLENLRQDRQYEAWLFFVMDPWGRPQPGDRIGDLEFIEEPPIASQLLSDLPEPGPVKEADGSEWEEDPGAIVWSHLTFRATGPSGVQATLKEKFETPFAVLAFCGGWHFRVRNNQLPWGVVTGPSGEQLWTSRPDEPGWREEALLVSFAEGAEIWTELCRLASAEPPTKLTERILSSIRTWFLATETSDVGIRTVLLIAALESLLLTKADRARLTDRLAEKIAILSNVADEEDRVRLYKEIKRAYNKRSRYVHDGRVPSSAGMLERYYQHVLERVILLAKDHPSLQTVDEELLRMRLTRPGSS